MLYLCVHRRQPTSMRARACMAAFVALVGLAVPRWQLLAVTARPLQIEDTHCVLEATKNPKADNPLITFLPIHACMHVCVCVCVRAGVCVSVHACVQMCVQMCVRACVKACVHEGVRA